ncbi:MAG TPA: hypothetical protein VFL47_06570 [Flavisolibacter sp.]|nr:hypothetical protein [Flavisolibacter sp.]
MKAFVIMLMAIVALTSGCDLRQREEALQQKEEALNEREQQLLLKERTLQAKEEELGKQQKRLDSTLVSDSTHKIIPALAGSWSVKMTCIEATCPGSAVGDTKTEVWQFSYAGNTLVGKAMAGDKLVRVYTGYVVESTIELKEERTGTDNTPPANINVRLHIVDDLHMEGQREITREGECRIVYDLQLQKQTS